MYARFLRSTDAALEQQIDERRCALRTADDPRLNHELQQLLHIRLEREAEAWAAKHFEGNRLDEIRRALEEGFSKPEHTQWKTDYGAPKLSRIEDIVRSPVFRAGRCNATTVSGHPCMRAAASGCDGMCFTHARMKYAKPIDPPHQAVQC